MFSQVPSLQGWKVICTHCTMHIKVIENSLQMQAYGSNESLHHANEEMYPIVQNFSPLS